MRWLLCWLLHRSSMLAFYTATTEKKMIYVGSVCTRCHDLVNVEALYNRVRAVS